VLPTDDVETEVVTLEHLHEELQRLVDDGWTVMSVIFASEDRIAVTVKRSGAFAAPGDGRAKPTPFSWVEGNGSDDGRGDDGTAR
jgi:hypothetical protein